MQCFCTSMFATGLAVYDQIVRQVKFAVADGALRSGDLVPSVRELARELAINPNTVARAYRQLQDDGVLETVRGTGLAIAAAARRQCQAERTKLIRCRLRLVLEEALHSGLDTDDIEVLMRERIGRRRAAQTQMRFPANPKQSHAKARHKSQHEEPPSEKKESLHVFDALTCSDRFVQISSCVFLCLFVGQYK